MSVDTAVWIYIVCLILILIWVAIWVFTGLK